MIHPHQLDSESVGLLGFVLVEALCHVGQRLMCKYPYSYLKSNSLVEF